MKKWAYYNECDPFAAKWLRQLIKGGLIAPGEVDERSIEDVTPVDVKTFRQCHWFAGIGTWSYALRRAGWEDDGPECWTGSAPCQPFSAAGKGAGTADERHLWPAWFWLISQSKPGVIFGEQVASRDGLAWLDIVSSDLEATGYAVGALDLCAAGFGAPHKRQRLHFVAHAASQRHDRRRSGKAGSGKRQAWGESERLRAFGVAQDDAKSQRLQGNGATWQQEPKTRRKEGQSKRAGPVNGFWRNAQWFPCTDGKARAVEPGTSPLAHGTPARVGRLRGYGNAIVAPVAIEFIKAYMKS